MKETSADTISLRGAGIITIVQPEKGYRFTLDSLLLADFCRIRPRDRVLEPGAGTGVISVLLAKKFPHARFITDELDPQAYELLCRNIEKNSLADSIVAMNRDASYLSKTIVPNSFDAIVANPPYVKWGAGRTSPVIERQTARHEQTASLPLWINLQVLLKNKGRYFFVFPAQRAAELVSLLQNKGLAPKRLRCVHPHGDKSASLILLEAVKGGGIGMDVLPPLIIHERNGTYTDEMKEIYGMKIPGVPPVRKSRIMI